MVSATVVSISPQRHALARQGDRNVGKTPLVIGAMLGITQFLNGLPSFNEAAGMSGSDSIQLRQKMWRPKGYYNLSRRVVASSGQLRPAVASCGLLWLAVAGCGWLQVAKIGQGLATAWPGMAKSIELVA